MLTATNEQAGVIDKELRLPNGVVIEKITKDEMNELMKTAPIVVKWPFLERIPQDARRMNVGASSCLMTYDFGKNETFQGHFTVVLEHARAEEREKSDYNVYLEWLQHVKMLVSKDPNAVIVLVGQHMSNLKSQSESILLKERWGHKLKQVDEDLEKIGVSKQQIVDLRGPQVGSTTAFYDSEKKKLYYATSPGV